jgi:hypothetical protein
MCQRSEEGISGIIANHGIHWQKTKGNRFMTNDLAPFFSPKGVAIIGASTNPKKLSHGILKNLTLYGYQA